jgi:phosphate uptake regulator
MSDKFSAEEMRKIQLTGGSTYIVSLPKRWVEKMGLQRGSLVGITRLDDLSLRIQPKGAEREEKQKRAVINVSDNDDPEGVVRRLVSAYLLGYNIIQIKTDQNRLDPSQRYAVKDFTRKKLVGTEILSDLPRDLTLQVLLSYSELLVEDALRRMSIIAASMHRDAIVALQTDDPRLAREIIAMDDEVDRFSLYIIRLLKAAVSDSHILREIKLYSPRECLGYRLITKSVERMADHAVKISQNSLALSPSSLNDEIINELKMISGAALKVFEDSVEALFDRSYTAADKMIMSAEETREMEAVVIQKIIKNASVEDVASLRLIVESILRTAEYGSDIAETVLNMTIMDELGEV